VNLGFTSKNQKEVKARAKVKMETKKIVATSLKHTNME
jgi:hypothetical protein